MTEQVKINPDLLIILVGSVINKFMTNYQGDYKECRATFPVDQFIHDLNKITQEYTSRFPNVDIHFPQIDLKLLSFIITRTLYHKFVTVTQDRVIIDVLPHVYENFLKNIVATSTLRYAKYLLKGAKDLYEEDKKKVKDNSEKTMPISAPNLLKEKEPVASKPSETKDEKLKEPLVKATKEVNDEKETPKEDNSPVKDVSDSSKKDAIEVQTEKNNDIVPETTNEVAENAKDVQQTEPGPE